MKTFSAVILGVLIFSMGRTTPALATGPFETVELGVDFQISKCTSSNGESSTCDSAASLPTNIAIELKNCSS